MRINRPIFILSTGRSGSSVLHRMLTGHPHVAWTTGLCNRFPSKPVINRFFIETVKLPLIGEILKRKLKPSEVYEFWEFLYPGFRDTYRDLLADDVTVKTKRVIQDALFNLTSQRRSRLLMKITGWSRIGFLNNIFPDAKFIHIVRDGRAVANSYINVSWWTGWKGPENWRWGPLEPNLQQIWESHQKSFLALAAIQWMILIQAIDKARDQIDRQNYLEIKYENLCKDPITEIKRITNHCNLEWSIRFERSISQYRLIDANIRWTDELTDHQQGILNGVLSKGLQNKGYIN